jgi:hypothetical protein
MNYDRFRWYVYIAETQVMAMPWAIMDAVETGREIINQWKIS